MSIKNEKDHLKKKKGKKCEWMYELLLGRCLTRIRLGLTIQLPCGYWVLFCCFDRPFGNTVSPNNTNTLKDSLVRSDRKSKTDLVGWWKWPVELTGRYRPLRPELTPVEPSRTAPSVFLQVPFSSSFSFLF